MNPTPRTHPERFSLGQRELMRMFGLSPERYYNDAHAYADDLQIIPEIHKPRVTAPTHEKFYPEFGITLDEWREFTDAGGRFVIDFEDWSHLDEELIPVDGYLQDEEIVEILAEQIA